MSWMGTVAVLSCLAGGLSAQEPAIGNHSGHEVHLFQPDAVVQAITDVVNAARTKTRLPTRQQRPDFSGHWKLDPQATALLGGGRGDASGNASGGGGGGGGGTGLGAPAEALTIRQNDTTMTVEEQRDDGSVIIAYKLKGGRVKNTMPIGRGGTTTAEYSSKWDDAKLSTSINRTVTGRGSPVTLRYRELRYLAADGSMVVETTISGRPGGRKVVYRKSDS